MNNPFSLILIDDDPIFRLGLCTALESFPHLQVVAQADSAAALEILGRSAATENAIDLVILAVDQLPLCQQLKTQYPTLPVFLLCSSRDPAQLAAARAIGIEGYCPKGTSLSKLVAAMRLVAAGQTYWSEIITKESVVRGQRTIPLVSHATSFFLAGGQSGLRQINATLTEVTTQLQNPRLSRVDWLIVSGRRRELLAARWLVNQLLPSAKGTTQQPLLSSHLPQLDQGQMTLTTRHISRAKPLKLDKEPNLFAATLDKLQSGLQNLTGVPMEIDILREEKKRELLDIILRRIENVLNQLRFSQVQPNQLLQKRATILQDLWQASIIDFFGKYYTLQLGNQEFEVISILMQDVEIVREAILEKISLTIDFLSYILFKTPLIIDNISYPFGTIEAREREEYLLQNLLIKIANSVVQPLLNHFADVEVIKQTFYDRRLLSSREIARFRNNLSWQYRWEKYIREPTAIFESRYSLFILSDNGIKQVSIYTPRTLELEQLTGIRLAVTLVLETRDAIAPRLHSAVALLGKGVVYVLTQVIGRGIGLIGRGIIQGIGSALQDTRFGKNNDREK